MKPVNIERHLGCENYAGCEEKGVYLELPMQPHETIEIKSEDKLLLIFVKTNDARYSISSLDGESLDDVYETRNAPFGMLVDKYHQLRIMMGEEGYLQIFKFEHLTHLCSGYSFSNLRRYAPMMMVHKTIEIYEPLELALGTIHRYVSDGLKCSQIMDAKLSEIFFVLSGYYRPETLGEFLAPLLRREVDFKEFVMMNHFRAKSVQDLADMRGLELRKFNKLFKETFNEPPYAWMLDQKAEMIEERLADPTVSFKEIMEEFHFSSPSHFTVFCKRQFNMTPSQCRKELTKDEAKRRAAARNANSNRYHR